MTINRKAENTRQTELDYAGRFVYDVASRTDEETRNAAGLAATTGDEYRSKKTTG